MDRIHQQLLFSSIHPEKGIFARIAQTPEVKWTPDLQMDLSSEHALRKSGLKLRVSVPILAEQEVVAIVECFRVERAERNEHEVNLFQTIATELGLVVERKRLQEGYAEAVWNQQRILAQELHDGLGQILAGTGFLSQALSQKLSDPAHSALSHQVTDGIERTLGQIRGLAKGVFPMELESGGVIPALEQLAASVESVYAIKCRFECEPSIKIQDSQIAIHLYRMAQEAVANAAKHAKPAEVNILLSKAQGRITLCVRDDGIGISVPAMAGGGSGLRTLRYRAAAIGATLSIEGSPGKGTRVLCSLPIGSLTAGTGAESAGVASYGHV
jgi:signal transduction histidine kinase